MGRESEMVRATEGTDRGGERRPADGGLHPGGASGSPDARAVMPDARADAAPDEGLAASRAVLFGLSGIRDRESLRSAACRSVAVASHLEMLIAPEELEPVDWQAWLGAAAEDQLRAMIASVNDYLAGVPDFDDEELFLTGRERAGGAHPGALRADA